MLAILAFLIAGLLAGWLASAMTKSRNLNVTGSMLVGAVGAFIGGLIFNSMNIGTPFAFWGALASAILGATILLLVAGFFAHLPHVNQRKTRSY